MVLRAVFSCYGRRGWGRLGLALRQQPLVGVTGYILLVALSVSVGLSPLCLPCWSLVAAAFLKASATPHCLCGWAARAPALLSLVSPLLLIRYPGREGQFSEGKGKASTASSPRSCLTPSDYCSGLPFAPPSPRFINVVSPSSVLCICAVQYGSHWSH